MTTPRAIATINLDAIAHNARVLKERAGVELMAVVKADAYGHGLVEVARAAQSGGAGWLGTALLEEGLALRAAGITGRIMCWLTAPDDAFADAIEADIDLSAGSLAAVQEIARAASKVGRPARLHIEVDTGMTRGGAIDELDSMLDAMKDQNLIFAGIWSHFARADEPGEPANDLQRQRFEEAIALAHSKGLTPEMRHLSNSAATLVDEKSRYDMVRCGIALYGLSPDFSSLGAASNYGLLPAMHLSARLALVKKVPAGSQVSYGGTFTTTADTTIGILPLGYADGVPRVSALHVQSREGRHPVIGRVCMDQVIVDLGPDTTLVAGDEITCFGPGGPSADDWGAWAGSIGYEIVTRLGVRVPRHFAL